MASMVVSPAEAARRTRSARLKSIVDAIGRTPLVRLRRVAAHTPRVDVFVKLEMCNPGGSVKDRAAFRMMSDAIADGRLTKSKSLLDATSGNTGVAYSMIGAALGYRITLVMPSNVSKARKDIARAYGTEIIYSDPLEGSDGAIRLAQKLARESSDRYFYCDQYSNPSNPLAHYHGTAAEILTCLGDRITHFVAGLGTSGTVMGCTRRLHEHRRSDVRTIQCVAVEPADALHGLEGLKHMASSLVPAIYDSSVPDEILPVTTEDGWDMADRVARDEGLHVGHSSGANIFGAIQLAERLERQGRSGCIVTIACDRGDRYFAPMRWEKRYTW